MTIHKEPRMSENDLSRRNFMTRTILGIFGFIGATMAATLGGFGIIPALKKEKSDWIEAGPASDLSSDQPQERRILAIIKSGWQSEKETRSVWLVKRADKSITAFSASCPHLGCGYRWVAAEHLFKCPCHGSVFDINGKVISGPAPRRLDTLETRVENGKVFVRHETFQLGTSAKISA